MGGQNATTISVLLSSATVATAVDTILLLFSKLLLHFRLLFLLLLLPLPAPPIGRRSSSSSLSSSVVVVSAIKLWNNVCTQSDTRSLPFCDVSLHVERRVKDYVSRVPVKQQVKMMGHVAAPYGTLHIPQYQWWNEGLHGALQPCVTTSNDRNFNRGIGNNRSCCCACPTSFPCPSALGTAFNVSLYERIGSAIGVEGRAISELRDHHGTDQRGDGLNYWSPTINLQRDPRWGRNQEVPGEDPVLTGQYAKHFVTGLQQGIVVHDHNNDNDNDDNDKNGRLRIAACCKHYAANSLDGWKQYSRSNFSANVTMTDLFNYYLPPFKTCAKYAAGVMCSINAVNGVPACLNDFLLKTVLRDWMEFDGYVTTDCSSIMNAVVGHKYVNDTVTAVAMAVNATTDVNCGHAPYNYPSALGTALDRHLVQAETVRSSFARLVRVQMRLGLFDNNKQRQNNHNNKAKDNNKAKELVQDAGDKKDASSYSYSSTSPMDVIDSPEHQQLAYEAAVQSIVLLRNENETLPLPRGISSVAVIGPHIHGTEVFLSNYHGNRCCGGGYGCIQTPLDAIEKANNNNNGGGGMTRGEVGCEVNSDLDRIDNAIALAKESNAVILLMGLDNTIERETLDRTETTLPGLQVRLVREVLKLRIPRTVLVLINGGAVSLGRDIIDQTPAIVDAFYGGQEASRAIADVLYGVYNPTAKLAATVYPPSYVNEIPLTEMGVTVGPGRTHLHYRGQPEFAFGHGLSYSNWEMHWMKDKKDQSNNNRGDDDPNLVVVQEVDGDNEESILDGNRNDSSSLTFRVYVRNAGPRAGRQTVLLFWRPVEVLPGVKGEEEEPRVGVGGGSASGSGSGGLVRQKLVDFAGTDFLETGQGQTLTFSIRLQDFAMWEEEQADFVVSEGSYQIVARAANRVELSRRIVVRPGRNDLYQSIVARSS